MCRVAFVLAIVAVFGIKYGIAHSYHLGRCPSVEPLSGFSMSRMLGVWYVIQKTSTASSCITYNFTRTDEPNEYLLEQVSQHFILGMTPLKHKYSYTGKLTVPDPTVPSKMNVRFPLSVAGSSSYSVFMSDYDNYAAVFTCQRLGFAHRQSATILSREKTLDKLYVDKIRTRLASYNIDPFDLSIISQSDCPKAVNGSTGIDINIDPDTIPNIVHGAGEKIGDGVEFVVDTAHNLYSNYGKSGTDRIPEDMQKLYSEFSEGVREAAEAHDTRHNPNEDVEAFNPGSDWLP